MALSWGMPIYLLTDHEERNTNFDDATGKLWLDEVNKILTGNWNCRDVVATHLGCKVKIEKFYYMI